MSNGFEIGTAYVHILPKTTDIGSNLTSALNSSTQGAGDSAGQSLGSSIVGKLKTVIAAAGIGALIKESISAGADYEQLTGGIETLFKSSSDTVMQYAQDAYKNVGMSANEYMETTTSFAASMIKSVGGDTEKAASQANKAITQMSDNANKMGTDMESISNAYKGFAKSNFTMLDNLSLGYSGSKEGMEQLLADAQAISGVEYDISSYSDIVDAIGVIQDEMGITGTTAKEAASTFSGSLGMMKSAAVNVLTAISSGGDVAGTLSTLVSSTGTFLFDNAIPMIGRMADGIWEGITQYGPVFLEQGIDTVSNLADGFFEGLPAMIESGTQAALNFIDGVANGDSAVLNKGIDLVKKIGSGIIQNLPLLATSGLKIIVKLAASIGQNAPQILQQGLALVGKLIAGIIQSIPKLPAAAKSLISSFKSAFSGYDWGSIGKNIVSGLINGLKSGVSSVVSAAKNVAQGALDAAKNALGIHSPSTKFEWISEMSIAGAVNGMKSNANKLYSAVSDTWGGTVSAAQIGSSSRYSSGLSSTAANGNAVVRLLQEIAAKNMTVSIGNREFTRCLEDVGVKFA